MQARQVKGSANFMRVGSGVVGPDWHLREWMVHFGKRQVSLTNELGWDKAKAHYYFHSKQQYRRDVLNQAAAWLGVEPFELLMRPDHALGLRRLHEMAQVIVAESSLPYGGPSKAPG